MTPDERTDWLKELDEIVGIWGTDKENQGWAYEQVTRLLSEVRRLDVENATLRDRVRVLEEALTPFAAYADRCPDLPDSCYGTVFKVSGGRVEPITLGDCRRAAAVLGQEGEEQAK